MSITISFGPGPDDVTVDGESNGIHLASDIDALVRSVNEGRARYFTAMQGIAVDGRGSHDCLLLSIHRADGIERRECIDLCASFGVTGAGNGNEFLASLVARQVSEGVPVVPGILAHRLLPPALSVLRKAAHMPAGISFFASDGALAADAALRVALNAAARRRTHGGDLIDGVDDAWDDFRIIGTEGSYHGSGGYPRSLMGSERARRGFGPLFRNIDHVPFGNLEALRSSMVSGAGRAAVFITEAVQGARGCIAPPEGYLENARALCREHGVVFVVDEIKTGFGRLGEFFYTASLGISPDIIIGGKSAGGGVLPFSFVIGEPDIMRGFEASTWGVTWTASPSQCIALLGFAKLLSDGLLSEVRRKSAVLDDRFARLRKRHARTILSFDGLGLMRSLETVFPADSLARALLNRGVFTIPVVAPDRAGLQSFRVSVAPVLTITDEHIEQVVEAFDAALHELAG